ncbi:M64 family metallopeptidase [Compostimonas suwonensis]|uniref:IgA peptidase M64 n=1 Tax=Compostimonas suwonensis TaxID=1048394 RepID=A0A2M9BZ03_9MICO|nr:M64 family metallopeptidase [Compostimonas suwonensis]PJJ63314.1 IgA peptidase M64 [Compostimonas suwonensis]
MSTPNPGSPRTRVQRATALLAVPLLAVTLAVGTAVAPAHADEPAVGSATLVPIQVTGDPQERFSLVILGDGYTAAEMPKFREQVEEHLETMWSIEPYKSYRNYFNVYAVEIVSGESGVSCDSSLDSPRRNTPLQMAFWGGCNASSVQRLLTVNNTLAKNFATLAPKVDQILALANSDTYGGAGGSYATASGGNALSALISPHELGHSLGKLDDEYDYYTRGITTGAYTGREPASKHHTLLTEQQMLDQQKKWWRWLGEPSEAGGTIGRYEGGQYYSTGLYRPSRHSIMKTLGYQYDQVGREIMTERISSKIKLVPRSTPTDAPVAPDSVVWLETAHPVYHELDVTWSINGTAVTGLDNARQLDLEGRDVVAGDTISATVVDNTEFVRDPALRGSASMTQVRTWTVGDTPVAPVAAPAEFTQASPTTHATGSKDVLYVETTHPSDHLLDVSWNVDGTVVPNAQKLNLALAPLSLDGGTHTVTATVSDPTDAAAGTDTQSWTIDAVGPQVDAVISAPIATTQGENGEPHYTVNESFSMKLTPSDDQSGALVAEFRLDGDGWHNYYGWPTDKNEPFLFTPTGTNIDDLIYGNLGTGGMSLSPFQAREPGYGTHRVEYRATDAAGNIGEVKAFTVTVLGGDDSDPRQVISATVAGSPLSLTVSSTDPITLPAVTLTGVDQVTAGELHPVQVVDSRGTSAGWDLTGQVSDFTSGTGTILADNLGWRPTAETYVGDLPVAPDETSAVTAGDVAAPGTGLGTASTLCSAETGHSSGSFTCAGGLDLGIPGSSRLGTYTGVLTLTLI